MYRHVISFLFLAFLLPSCNEIGSIGARKGTDQTSTVDTPQTITSDFWNLPYTVTGITYTNGNGEVFTIGSDGKVTCTVGEEITFSIGSIVLGSTICSENITLEDIAGTANPTDDAAVQLTLLLLSLDDDNDPTNGINIVNTAIDYTGTTPLDLTDPDAVADLIQELDPGTPVLDPVVVEETIDEETSPPAVAIVTTIADLIIENLTYTTDESGLNQETTSNGLISCLIGETITFYVGSVSIGTAICSNNITLQEIAGSTTPDGPEVEQLLLLLVSLDNDNDPTNGIDIVDTVDDYTGTVTDVDLTDPTKIADLIQDLDPGTPVIPISEIEDLLEEIIDDQTPPSSGNAILTELWSLPIENLTYTSTALGEKITGNQGNVACLENETVTFSIGTVILGTTQCSNNMSMQELAGTLSLNEDKALQLTLLLFSMDKNANVFDGIDIVDSAINYTGTTTLDLTNSAAVASLILELNPVYTNPSALMSSTHLLSTMIVSGVLPLLEATYNGNTTVSTDQTGNNLCPSGVSNLEIDETGDVSFKVPLSDDIPIDIEAAFQNPTLTTDGDTQLSTLSFTIPDANTEMNILDCSANGGYSNVVKFDLSGLPLITSPTTINATYQMYQVCTDGTPLYLCEGTFNGTK